MKVANEVRLLIACARLRLEPADRVELQACLDAGVDWDRVMRLAQWHGLRPLLHRHLSEAQGVPRAAMVRCWSEAERVARSNRMLRDELARILVLLGSAGIRALPYKGPTLAARAYGDLTLREFGDLDILVTLGEVQRARDLLCAGGYVREYDLKPDIERAYLRSKAQYHIVVRAPGGTPLVELHWKSDPDFPVERLDDDRWWAGTRTVDGLPALSDEDLLLVLCIHGSKHLWASMGWLVDVAELLRRECDVHWHGFAARVEFMGASRRVGVGLNLAADVLGVPLPEACEALARRADVRKLATALKDRILACEPRNPGV